MAGEHSLSMADWEQRGRNVAGGCGYAATVRDVGVLMPAWVATGWLVSKAAWFWNHRPDLEFGWIVLLLSAYVVYDGWGRRPAWALRVRPVGVILSVVGLAVLLLVQVYMAAFGMMAAALVALAAGVMGVVAGNLHLAFGTAGWRHFGFPFVFLLVALPMPSAVQGPLVSVLQAKVAWLNVQLLNLMGVAAQQVGSLIHLPNGTVGIDEACSGIRSLQSTVMATLFIGYLTLRRFWLQALLFGAGILLAIVGNVGRSLFLSLMANAHGVKSIDRYHDTAGWSILLFTACGVALLAWLLSRLNPLQGQPLNVKSTLDS